MAMDAGNVRNVNVPQSYTAQKGAPKPEVSGDPADSVNIGAGHGVSEQIDTAVVGAKIEAPSLETLSTGNAITTVDFATGLNTLGGNLPGALEGVAGIYSTELITLGGNKVADLKPLSGVGETPRVPVEAGLDVMNGLDSSSFQTFGGAIIRL